MSKKTNAVRVTKSKGFFYLTDMKAGDVVSVFSDLEGKCTRGATSFQGKTVFVGNGVADLDRSSIFNKEQTVKYVDAAFTYCVTHC